MTLVRSLITSSFAVLIPALAVSATLAGPGNIQLAQGTDGLPGGVERSPSRQLERSLPPKMPAPAPAPMPAAPRPQPAEVPAAAAPSPAPPVTANPAEPDAGKRPPEK